MIPNQFPAVSGVRRKRGQTAERRSAAVQHLKFNPSSIDDAFVSGSHTTTKVNSDHSRIDIGEIDSTACQVDRLRSRTDGTLSRCEVGQASVGSRVGRRSRSVHAR